MLTAVEGRHQEDQVAVVLVREKLVEVQLFVRVDHHVDQELPPNGLRRVELVIVFDNIDDLEELVDALQSGADRLISRILAAVRWCLEMQTYIYAE